VRHCDERYAWCSENLVVELRPDLSENKARKLLT